MEYNYRDLVVVVDGFYKRHKGFVKAFIGPGMYAVELTDGLVIEIEDYKLQLLRQAVVG